MSVRAEMNRDGRGWTGLESDYVFVILTSLVQSSVV